MDPKAGHWWLIPVITDTCEADIGRIKVQTQVSSEAIQQVMILVVQSQKSAHIIQSILTQFSK
jgi:hypothetical protein